MGDGGELGKSNRGGGDAIRRPMGESRGRDDLRAELSGHAARLPALQEDIQRRRRHVRRLRAGAGNGAGADEAAVDENMVSGGEESALRNIRRERA